MRTRCAVVTGASPDTIARYLPSNYSVVWNDEDSVLIVGTDSAGWTLDDYVPSLAMPLKLVAGLTDDTATVNAVAGLAKRVLGEH